MKWSSRLVLVFWLGTNWSLGAGAFPNVGQGTSTAVVGSRSLNSSEFMRGCLSMKMWGEYSKTSGEILRLGWKRSFPLGFA